MSRVRVSQDELNRSTWRTPEAQQWLAAAGGPTDPGEAVVLERLREEMAGRRILDIGVGPGRTVPLLTEISRDYVGLDYLPEMVRLARLHHPDLPFVVADARDLSAWDDAEFDLVVFSFNGIDAVDHEGRRAVLAEARRVLRPGGVFWYSTLNLDGPAFRARPWHLELGYPGRRWYGVPHAARRVLSMPRDLWGWSQVRSSGSGGPGWAVAPLGAHHYGVLAHFVRVERIPEETAEAGFLADPTILLSTDGRDVADAGHAGVRDVEWFHVLARTAGTPDADGATGAGVPAVG